MKADIYFSYREKTSTSSNPPCWEDPEKRKQWSERSQKIVETKLVEIWQQVPEEWLLDQFDEPRADLNIER